MEIFFLGVLVVLMMFTLGVGFPVAFSLPGSAIATIGLAAGAGWLFAGNADAFFAHGSAVQWLTAGVTNFRGVYWAADRDTLIAIPLFVFMGIMLQRSRIAEELLVTMAKLFGPLPGGLGISVVVVGALLAATTGIVGATVVAMGLISLPAMMRNNYSQPLATGTILSSGTLGQIIPPSIVLIILADQLSTAVDLAGSMRADQYKAATGEFSMPSQFGVTSTSAGDMFMGALVPGLILVGLYVLYILGYALLRPREAPSVPIEGRLDAAFWLNVFFATVPPLALIVIVLGSIITGVSTVTQAGAIGAAGAIVMAGYKLYEGRGRYAPATLAILSVIALWVLTTMFNLNVRQLGSSGEYLGVTLAAGVTLLLMAALVWSGWRTLRIGDTLRAVMIDTAKTSSLVFIILLGAAMLIAAFRGFGGEELVKTYLTTLPGGFWVQFFIVMLVIFLLGFFLDFIEIAIVVVPIVAPILLANPEANVTAVWLGVMIGMNIQTSFLTPPFGFALFYLRGVASSSVRTLSMYKGVIPFIALQIVALVIVGLNPPLVNYLPSRMSLLSETAPPPRNPRLQHCVDQILLRTIPAQEDEVRTAVEAVRTADSSMLPEDRAGDLASALEGYENSFKLLQDFATSRERVEEAKPGYRPLHRQVSALEQQASQADTRIRALRDELRTVRGDDDSAVARRDEINARIADFEREKERTLEQIPDRWDDAHERFRGLLNDEQRARMSFQRGAADSYRTLSELVAQIGASKDIAALLSDFEQIPEWIATLDPEPAAERIQDIERDLRELAGTNELQSAMRDLRRELTGRNPSPEDAREAADEVIAMARGEAEWRRAAADTLLEPLAALADRTSHTLGLLEQSDFTREQALEVAACNSHHRDISLNF